MIPKRFFIYAFILILLLMPGEIWQNLFNHARFFLEKNTICGSPIALEKTLTERFQKVELEKRVLVLTETPYNKTSQDTCIGPFTLSYNESLLSEATVAVTRGDVELLEFVLKKYAVDYLIVDYPEGENKGAFFAQSNILNLDEKTEDVLLYYVDRGENKSLDITTFPNVGPSNYTTFEDILFREVGDYISYSKDASNMYFPFLSVAQDISPDSMPLSIKEDDKYFFLHSQAPFSAHNYSANRPVSREEIAFDTGEVMITELNKTNLIEKNKDVISYFLKERVTHIDPKKPYIVPCEGTGKVETKTTEDGLQVFARNGQSVCFSYNLPTLKNTNGYLVKVKATHKRGKELLFSVIDSQKNILLSKKMLSKTSVHYLIVPPGKSDLTGYTFQFKSESDLLMTSENTATALEVYSFPYDEVLRSVYRHNSLQTPLKTHAAFKLSHPAWFIYKLDVEKTQNGMWLSLFQPHSNDWKAYEINRKLYGLETYAPMFFGKQLSEQHLLNGWANAWKISEKQSRSQVVIMYIPLFNAYLNAIVLLTILLSLFVLVWRSTYKRVFHR